MSKITSSATVTVDIPANEYSHNEAAQIFENIRAELFGTNAMKEHRVEETGEWEGSFMLPTPFETNDFTQLTQAYSDRYPGIDISLQPALEALLR